uniref:sn-1-specific diacylglycerol lipase ABHD11 n=1 Tax=Callorhinchus milii TaxID=7868 RepID=A0A4W3IEC9_CALMI
VVQRSGRTVVTVDCRNHGDSGHSPVMTFEAMSHDVQKLLDTLRLPECVLAQLVALSPLMVQKLIVVDVSPRTVAGSSSISQYISAMQAVALDSSLPLSAVRSQAEQQLQSHIKEAAVRQFILSNLVEEDGQYRWKMNLEAILNHLGDLLGFPEFHTSYTGPTLFLGGENTKDLPEISRLFPNSTVQYIAGAGHWIHAEKPQDFINSICKFLA